MGNLSKVAVIGAGTMGAGIAGVFARLGYDVAIQSRSEATLDKARAALGEVAARVHFSTSLETCLQGAGVVSENVAEDLDIKRTLFVRIENEVSGDCLLTTNTSSVPIGAIAIDMKAPWRLVGLHWFNPPAVMPLVEIVRGAKTSDTVVERVRTLCSVIGKDAIEVGTDLPGFVVNRLQYAILREALYLVESGVASIRDVDRAVETTLAPRWCAAGPLRLMDLAGLDTVAKVSAVLMQALDRSVGVPPFVERLVTEGAIGTKSGRGFYAWEPNEIVDAKAERDAIVTLLTERRKS